MRKKNKVVEISDLSFMERPGDGGVSDLEVFAPLKLPLKPPLSEAKPLISRFPVDSTGL